MAPPQRVRPARQVQAPAVHSLPAAQARPQVPQLAASCARSAQRGQVPAGQLEVPASQAQAPLAQVPVPQGWSQPPQWVTLLVTSTQAPEHSWKPVAQSTPQTPSWQTGTPPAAVGQALPQVPQFVRSVAASTQLVPQGRKPA